MLTSRFILASLVQLAFLGVLLLSGCGQKPADEKPTAGQADTSGQDAGGATSPSGSGDAGSKPEKPNDPPVKVVTKQGGVIVEFGAEGKPAGVRMLPGSKPPPSAPRVRERTQSVCRMCSRDPRSGRSRAALAAAVRKRASRSGVGGSKELLNWDSHHANRAWANSVIVLRVASSKRVPEIHFGRAQASASAWRI